MLDALNVLVGNSVSLYIGNNGTLETPINGTLYKHRKYYRVNDTIFTFNEVFGVNVSSTFILISAAIND